MFFPAAYKLVSLALLLTPVLSAPIHHQDGGDVPSITPTLDTRSTSFGHSHSHEADATMAKRDLAAYADIVARDDSSILEARSFNSMEEPLAKRDIQRLVRRKGSTSAPKVRSENGHLSVVC